MKSQKRKPGFTLVELLVVMAIIGILMSLVIGIAGAVNRGAAESQAKAQIADLMNEIEKYKSDRGTYPSGASQQERWNNFRDWYLDRYPGTAYTITEGTLRAGTNFQPLDPWGQEYRYEYNASTPFVYLIGSLGPDARFGNDDNPNNEDHLGKGDDITNRNGALQ